MIFIAKNEDGIPTWKLALQGKKTVTRRMKPLDVGKEFAIQPGRGKFAVCRALVISCFNSWDHWTEHKADICNYKKSEANLEGFNTWHGLMQFFEKNQIQFIDTYRIEYELVK
jgi:hypothetical protein